MLSRLWWTVLVAVLLPGAARAQIYEPGEEGTFSIIGRDPATGQLGMAAKRDRETSLNPAVFDNAAFVTMGDWVQYKYVGVAAHEPDMAVAQS